MPSTRTARITAVVTATGATAITIHPILGPVLAAGVLGALATAAAIVLPAAWSGKKHRRDAALAVLHVLLSHTTRKDGSVRSTALSLVA